MSMAITMNLMLNYFKLRLSSNLATTFLDRFRHTIDGLVPLFKQDFFILRVYKATHQV